MKQDKVKRRIERLKKQALADILPLAQGVMAFAAMRLEEVKARGAGDQVVVPEGGNPLAAVRRHFGMSRKELAGLAGLYTSRTSEEGRVLRTIEMMETKGITPRRTSMWTVALVPTLAALRVNVSQLEKGLFAWAVRHGHIKIRRPLSPCFTSMGFGLRGIT
jgi:hypothetical protein